MVDSITQMSAGHHLNKFQCTVNLTTFLHERRAHIFPVKLTHEHFHVMDVADISIHLHWFILF